MHFFDGDSVLVSFSTPALKFWNKRKTSIYLFCSCSFYQPFSHDVFRFWTYHAFDRMARSDDGQTLANTLLFVLDRMAAGEWMTVRLLIFVLMMVSAILFRAFDRMAGSDDGQTSAIMFELLAEWPEVSGWKCFSQVILIS